MTEFKSEQKHKGPPFFGIDRATLDANQTREEARRRQAIADSAKGVGNELQAHLNRLGKLRNTDLLLTPKPESSLIEHHPEKPDLLTKKPIK